MRLFLWIAVFGCKGSDTGSPFSNTGDDTGPAQPDETGETGETGETAVETGETAQETGDSGDPPVALAPFDDCTAISRYDFGPDATVEVKTTEVYTTFGALGTREVDDLDDGSIQWRVENFYNAVPALEVVLDDLDGDGPDSAKETTYFYQDLLIEYLEVDDDSDGVLESVWRYSYALDVLEEIEVYDGTESALLSVYAYVVDTIPGVVAITETTDADADGEPESSYEQVFTDGLLTAERWDTDLDEVPEKLIDYSYDGAGKLSVELRSTWIGSEYLDVRTTRTYDGDGYPLLDEIDVYDDDSVEAQVTYAWSCP